MATAVFRGGHATPKCPKENFLKTGIVATLVWFIIEEESVIIALNKAQNAGLLSLYLNTKIQ